jgi:predicted HAD superfamily Cof-like phosphohydrolase
MEIKEIKNWFEIAIPEPTIEQACIQIGCHYEEVAEMMEPLYEHYHVSDVICAIANEYKSSDEDHVEHLLMIGSQEKKDLLDSLCDQIVTAIGVAHMFGMDIESALAEVNRSNHSKFENGKPVFNAQGKISKGKNYTPPQLEKFI